MAMRGDDPENRPLKEPRESTVIKKRRGRPAWITLEDGEWIAWVEHEGLATDINKSPKPGEVLRLLGDGFDVRLDMGGERRKRCKNTTKFS